LQLSSWVFPAGFLSWNTVLELLSCRCGTVIAGL
jgi:hypothetical protein